MGPMARKMKTTVLAPWLWLSLGLIGACSSEPAQTAVLPDAAAASDGSADASSDVSPDVSSDAPQAGCAELPATASCRLSGGYDLTYDQVVIESTPDSSGLSCRQASGLQRVVFTASPGRLCAPVDRLAVSADGCTIELTSRDHTSGGSESWTSETALKLTFAPQDGGTLAGQGTARLSVSGFLVCTKTATVSAQPR
jgi:hypothetical protein